MRDMASKLVAMHVSSLGYARLGVGIVFVLIVVGGKHAH